MQQIELLRDAIRLFSVLVCCLAGLPGFTASTAMADSIATLLNGKIITFRVSCERAGQGDWTLSLNNKGNLLFKESIGKPVEIIEGTGRTEYFYYTAEMKGNEIIITSDGLKLSGVRFTDTIRVETNSCSARHDVEPGEFMEAIDPTCKAIRCTIRNSGKR
jgi:hypothetical protein